MNVFSSKNAAMLLIDHQVGTMGWVGSISFEEMKRNAILLAKAARAVNLPTVLTSSQEERVQGPLLPELAEILPLEFENRVKRAGVVNSMADPDFAAAFEKAAAGRKNVIVAGAVITSTNQLISELAQDWSTEEGMKLQEVVVEGLTALFNQ